MDEPIEQVLQAVRDLTERVASLEPILLDDPEESVAYTMMMSVRAELVAIEQLLHLIRMEQQLYRQSVDPERKKIYADPVRLRRDDTV